LQKKTEKFTAQKPACPYGKGRLKVSGSEEGNVVDVLRAGKKVGTGCEF
jgi:hypothetical protein